MLKHDFKAGFNSGVLLLALGITGFGFITAARAATGTITFDFGITVRRGSPYVFGGVEYPMKAQQDDFYPKLKDAGVTFLRSDFYFQEIIPESICPTVDDYKNNVNDIQNPDKWHYDHLFWIDSSRKYGFKTLIDTTYTPTWLSCSGTYQGVPKDWGVWEDIVRKVYTRYKTRVDWVENWNEVEYWGDLTGSPYSNKEDFMVDQFYHTVKAIRDAGGSVPTGGFAFAYDETGMFGDILKKLVDKYGLDWTERNFNFYSVHHYGDNPGDINWPDIWGAFRGAGLNPDRAVFVDEWNYTTDWGRRPGELFNAKAIGYVGRSLASFINHGVNAAYFSMNPSQFLFPDGSITMLSFYTVGSNNITAPLPQSYPFKILSNRLGLGKGPYLVKAVSNQTVFNGCCAVNAAGQKVAFIVNYSDSPNTVEITFKGLAGRQIAITDYYGNTWDPSIPAYQVTMRNIKDGTAHHTINMPANTCVGLVIVEKPAASPGTNHP